MSKPATRRHTITAFKAAPSDNARDRTVMVTCGRGNFRVTPLEAMTLARDLLLAAGPVAVPEVEACVWCNQRAARLLLCDVCKVKLAVLTGGGRDADRDHPPLGVL